MPPCVFFAVATLFHEHMREAHSFFREARSAFSLARLVIKVHVCT